MPDLIIPSRQDFIDAIEDGIKAAGNQFSEARVKRLRHYAQTAVSFACGTWNADGIPCPLDAIGGTPDDPGAKEFTKAYDEKMLAIVKPSGKWAAMRASRSSSGSPILGPQRGVLHDREIAHARAVAR